MNTSLSKSEAALCLTALVFWQRELNKTTGVVSPAMRQVAALVDPQITALAQRLAAPGPTLAFPLDQLTYPLLETHHV
jgi:hypothetical protein